MSDNMDKALSGTTDALKIKIEKLIHLHKSLQEENRQLKQDNSDLKNRLSVHSDEIKALQQKQVVLKLSNTIGRNDEKKTEVKRKINELIKEIDRCIAMLNN